MLASNLDAGMDPNTGFPYSGFTWQSVTFPAASPTATYYTSIGVPLTKDSPRVGHLVSRGPRRRTPTSKSEIPCWPVRPRGVPPICKRWTHAEYLHRCIQDPCDRESAAAFRGVVDPVGQAMLVVIAALALMATIPVVVITTTVNQLPLTAENLNWNSA